MPGRRTEDAVVTIGENDDVLIPTAVWHSGTGAQGPSTATLAGSGRHGGGGAVGAFGQRAEPPLPPPAPLVDSVGDIAGLRPRRRRRDGGEVPGADVDLIDALPRTDDEPLPGQRASWPTVAAWLRSGKSAATRRARLTDLAKFVRWWAATAPGAGLWQVSEDVLVAYAEQLGTGSGHAAGLTRGGASLADATVKRHISTLKSLYGYAVRRRVIGHSPAAFVDTPEVGKVGTTPALALNEAAALVRGAQKIAERHPVDAAAVMLLATLGLRAGELEGLTVGRLERDAGHWVIRFRLKGGKNIAVPLAAEVMTLLRPLMTGRAPGDLLLLRADGRSFDRWRQQTALRRAARAAGLDLAKLTPHVLRATAATLLRAAGVPVDVVQELLGHASPVTTQRYDRGQTALDGHAAYQLTDLLTTQQPTSGSGDRTAGTSPEVTTSTDASETPATARPRRRPPRHRGAQPLAGRLRKPVDPPRRKR
ncbi:site-specific recombinase XerD [Nonomuraea fuscirosea]|uniref:Site-specific recombinase XerD n=1 Tax=Nonomuraea fuscirosea TaxID=1291556 RepID=A0A2T0LT12_9ACTN|nr:site-specific recombinase XerD [Nonomuraea fuscirosea]